MMLDEWYLVGKMVTGKIYGHPNLEDGTKFTAGVSDADIAGCQITGSGGIIKLGKMKVADNQMTFEELDELWLR